jgi:DNA (cytosine-5)-methyltransferase 1
MFIPFNFEPEVLEILSGRVGRGCMTAIDLFSGGGIFTIGLRLAGIGVVQGYDNCQAAIDCCRLNLGHGRVLDLRDADKAVEIIKEDLGGAPLHGIAGGPPCTDYSPCGNRKEDGAAELSVSYAMIVSKLRPWWIVMENVPEVLTSGTYTNIVRPMLKEAGYGLDHAIWDFSFNGGAQIRKRAFVFGFYGLEDGQLDYFLKKAFRQDPWGHNRTTRTRLRRQGFSNPCETVVSDVLPEIDTPFLTRRTRNRTQRAVFSSSEPYPTLVAQRWGEQNARTYVAKSSDAGPLALSREPTWDEKKVLQGIPEEYSFPEGLAEGWKQYVIGNSVPVQLGQQAGWVLNEVYKHLEMVAVQKYGYGCLKALATAPQRALQEDI